jgi:hypothetical protein
VPWLRAGAVFALVGALLSVPSAAAQEQDVREYTGTFTPPRNAGAIEVNRARFVVSPAGLGADLHLKFVDQVNGGACLEYVVNTLDDPIQVDTTTSNPQQVRGAVPVTLSGGSGAGAPCADPFTENGSIDLVLQSDVILGTLFFIEQEFEFRAEISAGAAGSTGVDDDDGGSGLTPGLEEFLTGSGLNRDSSRALQDLAGCPSSEQGPCGDAFRAGVEFANAASAHLNDRNVINALAGAVYVGTLRRTDGRSVVPSVGRMFPVLLTLAARADAGDAEALVALQRLVAGLTALSIGAQP